MRSNDSVTSVDIVHCLHNPETKKLELWLGEAKLYGDLSKAKYEALKSVEPLWDSAFLAEMKALVGPKLEANSDVVEELTWLFSEEASLDQIVDRLVIPICIACDCEATKSATARTPEYIQAVTKELVELRTYLVERVPSIAKEQPDAARPDRHEQMGRWLSYLASAGSIRRRTGSTKATIPAKRKALAHPNRRTVIRENKLGPRSRGC